MKKILPIIVLLAISSMFCFGQNEGFRLSKTKSFNENAHQNSNPYLIKSVNSNTKASIWYNPMTVASNWVASYGPGSTINIPWTWIPDTSAAAPLFDAYVHSSEYMTSPTCTTGLFYIDANTPSFANPPQYGTYNSILTYNAPISTLGYNAVAIKFFQTYYSYNNDTTYVDVSTDNINWTSIMANPEITGGSANVAAYGWKMINISTLAANKAAVYIRFRFAAPELSGTPPQQVYGGGYGWMIDDVELIEPGNNVVQVNRVTLHDGYSQIPSGLGMPMYYDADITNIGALTQTNVKLHGVDLTSGTDSVSVLDTNLLPMQSLTFVNTAADFFIWYVNDFYTPPTTQGTYKVTSYISTDSIAYLAQDTFSMNVVAPTGMYSRDNNTYTGSRWLGSSTSGTSDAYTAANRFEVNTSRMAYGANLVVSTDTKPGSKIQAVLYTINSGSGLKVKVAESKNQYIAADKIPTTVPMVNPPSINLAFVSGNPAVPTGFTMEKDTVYLLGISVYGGTDTVKIATDNTGIPQWEQTSLVFDPSDNTWYKWTSGNVPAQMIRVVFDPTLAINEISNNSATLFSCMPNPANNTTQISYELKNSEKTTILITDLMGRTVKHLNQGTQTKGSYSVEIDLSDLSSGTYFYTLKTNSAQVTDKLIIVKR